MHPNSGPMRRRTKLGRGSGATLMSIDIAGLMERLSRDRPIFHSEADFQHAFAWRIHTEHPNARIRLETRPERRIRLDVLIDLGDERIAIELKYLVRGTRLEVHGELFDLPNQAAQDLSRYDFIKDVERLEGFVADGIVDSGWTIGLSNDPSYWQPGVKADPVDALFRLHEGRDLSGTLSWGMLAGKGTTKNRNTPLSLSGRYTCRWRSFSRIDSESRPMEFRYLALEIRPASIN